MFIVTKCNESPGDGIIKRKKEHFNHIVSSGSEIEICVDKRFYLRPNIWYENLRCRQKKYERPIEILQLI